MAGAPERAAMPRVGEPIVEWAVWYAVVLRWRVFPVRRDTKQPYTKHGFKDASTDEAVIRAWWAKHPTANIGLAIPAGWLVVDVDARNDGVVTLNELEHTYSLLPRTLTNLTGSGGGSAHYCFTVAPDADLRGTLGQGLDIRLGEKHYIIVPPSIHANGQRYMWEADYGPDDIEPQPAPAWLMALLAQPSNGHSNGQAIVDDGGPIFEGTREKMLLHIGGTVLSQKKSPAEVYEAMSTANRTRCIPAYDEPHVQKLMENLYKADARHKAEKAELIVHTKAVAFGFSSIAPPHTAANDRPPGGLPIIEGWRAGLFEKKNRELFQNVTNIKLLLQHHPHWQDPINALWWDTVRGRPMCGREEIDSTRMIDICDWFGRGGNMPVTRPSLVETCVIAQCHAQGRDLLRLWLESLVAWNKQEHLTTWLHDIAGARNDTYGQETARVLLVSMVARALDPGCHYRFVVIFQGDEEIGKTALVRAIATREWYVELAMNLESKESHMMLQGVWVAEMSELDSLTRTEETRLKGFITQAEDSYVPKFSNFREKTPRRAIFVGTTNDECFLKGQSGNTRYLPITLPYAVDLPAFEAMREQLFAEALAYYRAHPDDWWQLSSDALEMAREEREHRRVANPYEQPLHEWLTITRHKTKYYEEGNADPVKFEAGETTWPEIARWFLKLETPEKWKDRSLQMQLGGALRSIGWRVRQVWRHGRNTNVWYQASSDT